MPKKKKKRVIVNWPGKMLQEVVKCVSLLITYIIAPTPCSIPRKAALQSCVFKRKETGLPLSTAGERQGSCRSRVSQEPCVLGSGLHYTGVSPGAGLTASQGQILRDKATGCSRKRSPEKIKNPKSDPYLFYALCG